MKETQPSWGHNICFDSTSGGDVEVSYHRLCINIHSNISAKTDKDRCAVTAQLCMTQDTKVYGLVPVTIVGFTRMGSSSG